MDHACAWKTERQSANPIHSDRKVLWRRSTAPSTGAFHRQPAETTPDPDRWARRMGQTTGPDNRARQWGRAIGAMQPGPNRGARQKGHAMMGGRPIAGRRSLCALPQTGLTVWLQRMPAIRRRAGRNAAGAMGHMAAVSLFRSVQAAWPMLRRQGMLEALPTPVSARAQESAW